MLELPHARKLALDLVVQEDGEAEGNGERVDSQEKECVCFQDGDAKVLIRLSSRSSLKVWRRVSAENEDEFIQTCCFFFPRPRVCDLPQHHPPQP